MFTKTAFHENLHPFVYACFLSMKTAFWKQALRLAFVYDLFFFMYIVFAFWNIFVRIRVFMKTYFFWKYRFLSISFLGKRFWKRFFPRRARLIVCSETDFLKTFSEHAFWEIFRPLWLTSMSENIFWEKVYVWLFSASVLWYFWNAITKTVLCKLRLIFSWKLVFYVALFCWWRTLFWKLISFMRRLVVFFLWFFLTTCFFCKQCFLKTILKRKRGRERERKREREREPYDQVAQAKWWEHHWGPVGKQQKSFSEKVPAAFWCLSFGAADQHGARANSDIFGSAWPQLCSGKRAGANSNRFGSAWPLPSPDAWAKANSDHFRFAVCSDFAIFPKVNAASRS